MIDMIPEMIGLRECASRTGLSYNSLRLMCLNNQIPYIRVGTTTKGKLKVNYTALCRILNGEEATNNG